MTIVIGIVRTKIIATLLAVYGVFMPPIGWGWAALVWGYALAWFLVNDRIKLATQSMFDPESRSLLGRTRPRRVVS